MSWLSKISGSDAKKRNVRKLAAAGKAAAEAGALGQNPADIFMPAVQDWVNTNNRVNIQTGLKGAAAATGIGLAGAPTAAATSAVPSAGGSAASTGAMAKLAGLAKGAGSLAGNTLKNTFMKDGGLDLSKLLGVATGVSAIKGSADKRKGADAYNASNAALRQTMFDKLAQSPDYSALMERLTARPNYKF